jgi:hypothetical protein
MDLNSVPQDDSSTYAKMHKTIYAKDSDGKMQSVSSTGWNVEETVTRQALDDIDENTQEALRAVKAGEKSTLYYHMYEARMDLVILAQSTGFFQWRIKKDFNPKTFKMISEKRLLTYCDALGKTAQELRGLPEEENE